LGVLHCRFDFDQVGIGSEHPGVIGHAELLRDVDDALRLDRPRQIPVVSGSRGLHVLAEAQNDGPLLRVNAIQAAANPHRPDEHQYTGNSLAEACGILAAPKAAAAAAAPEQRTEAPLEVSQNIVQIVLRLLGWVPGMAFFPARFIPSHELCLMISCGVSGSWMNSRAF